MERVARLAKLKLTGEETGEMTAHFERMLELVDSLDRAPQKDPGEEPESRFRPDEPGESLHRSEVLGNAPDTQSGYIRFVSPLKEE